MRAVRLFGDDTTGARRDLPAFSASALSNLECGLAPWAAVGAGATRRTRTEDVVTRRLSADRDLRARGAGWGEEGSRVRKPFLPTPAAVLVYKTKSVRRTVFCPNGTKSEKRSVRKTNATVSNEISVESSLPVGNGGRSLGWTGRCCISVKSLKARINRSKSYNFCIFLE